MNTDSVGHRGQLSAGVVMALRAAHARECAATGVERHAAFRVTGQLLGAAIACGFPVRSLAECLGTSPSSVRSRARRSGWLLASEAEVVCGISATTLADYTAAGKLPAARHGDFGQPTYRVADLLALLIEEQP